jgi:KTSC domain-containing protein
MPSSVIAGIEYDGQSHTLRVIYVSGIGYDYKNVPEEIYRAMKTAFSKGIFLNKYIKGKYEFKKIAG